MINQLCWAYVFDSTRVQTIFLSVLLSDNVNCYLTGAHNTLVVGLGSTSVNWFGVLTKTGV